MAKTRKSFIDRVTNIFSAAVVVLLLTATVSAQPAVRPDELVRLEDVSVTHEPDLRVSFVVKGAFTEGIVDAIKSGIPTSFTFKIYLYRSGWFRWFTDEHMGSWKFNHTVKYDPLKEEYEVTLDETREVVKTKDFSEVETLMVTGDDIAIMPSPRLNKGETYKVSIKAELDKIKLPLYLDYILIFVKLWDFETHWYNHTFVH
jgi:hypothetical protein